MFFYYNHNANGRLLTSVGGTDVPRPGYASDARCTYTPDPVGPRWDSRYGDLFSLKYV